MTQTVMIDPTLPVYERLLKAGAKLFADKGFDGVSVREICKSADTSMNMIHHYFGSKDGLKQAVFQRYGETVYTIPMRLLEKPAQSREDLLTRFELLLETTLEASMRERDVMLVVLREQAELPPLEAFHDAYVAFLKQAQVDGFLNPDLDVDLTSGAMLDRVVSQVHFAPWIKRTTGQDLYGDDTYRRDWCRANAELFLNGYLSR